jgi:alkylation response protein AidB-like acyl-CoA dehydrogenase
MPTTAQPQPITIQRGGEWLLAAQTPPTTFTPERLTDEHRLIAQTVADFVAGEVMPVLDRLEAKDWALTRRLLQRCGELGFLGVDVAEAYGGLQLDKATSLLVSERMARSASFGASFGAHANLTIVPLSLFGTEAQKRDYLPRLMSGEIVGAYCLSEPGSGSDALGAKTRATRQADGSFVLNGEKTWITNGGFADVYIVFAKVIDPPGEQFTAFIVDRTLKGVSNGKEEHKMGLHGSSTTPVILQDVHVAADRVLGEVGKGHKVAFNVLNFARFKLGAMCCGGAREAIGQAARYAAERRQFGQPIATFGAIKHKLGEMVARTYAVESLIYRTAGLIDARLAATPHEPTDQSAALEAFEEYAVEASMAKVAASEVLDFVLDENIQIHGGNGFVRDYPAEREYRDSRVNRIFEGTNEINRLLIPGMLARRAAKGQPPLIAAAKALQDDLLAPPAAALPVDVPLGEEARTVEALKKAGLMIFGLALQTYGQKLTDQQEVLTFVADIAMDVFSADSAVLRARTALESGNSRVSLHVDAARTFVNDAAIRVEGTSRQAVAAMADGDTLRTLLAASRRLFKALPVNTVELRRRLADEAVRRGAYPI